MIHHLKRAAAALLLACSATLAFAQTACDLVLNDYAYWLTMNQSIAAEILENRPECFAGSATTASMRIAATSFSHALAISRAIGSRLNPAPDGQIASTGTPTGLAAGGTLQAWNFWGSIEQNETDFSYLVNAGRNRGANDVRTTVVGVDYALSPQLVAGLSLAFDRGEGWGRRNANAKNHNDIDGHLIAPYLGYQLNKEWTLDASFGFGSGDFSASGGVEADADRWFAAANLSYVRWVGNWQFTGKASYLHGEEDYGNSKVNGATQANTASTNTLDQVRIGVQAGYWVNGFMPYAGLGYTSNVHRSSDLGEDPLGRDALIAALGVNFFSLSSKVTGGFLYEEELNRSRSDNRVLSANLNFRF